MTEANSIVTRWVMAAALCLQGCAGPAGPAPVPKLDEPAADTVRVLAEIQATGAIDRAAILKLLDEKRYVDLNSVMNAYQARFMNDAVAHEEMLVDAFRTFQQNDDYLLDKLLAWTNATPRAWQPYAARSVCATARGWGSRGTKLARDTRPGQFELMAKFHTVAVNDAAQAVKLEPDAFIAYRTLVQVADSAEDGLKALTVGLLRFPYSYSLRWHAMHKMQPRWGGSYELLRMVANDAQPLSSRAPRLRTLLGYQHAARAQDLWQDKKLAEAHDELTKALSYGEEADWYEDRAEVAYGLERYDDALADVARQADLSKGRFEEDVVGKFAGRLWRTSQRMVGEQNFQGALPICAALSRHHPANETYLKCNGRALQNLRKYREAVPVYQALIRLQPDKLSEYMGLRLVLAELRRSAEFLPVINRYIAAHPDDGEGYAWRAATLMRMGNYKKGRLEMRKACELGDENACTQPGGR
ncbi:MAG: tetratricopeptide repeat protein [Gammaproteobacteria bacterium]